MKEKKTTDEPTLPVEKWPQRPVLLQAGEGMRSFCMNESGEQVYTCPIGTSFGFESDLFQGRVLFRVRGLNDSTNDKYFEGRNRKNQIVVQGQFKRDDILVKDVVIGREYSRSFLKKPPRWVNSIIKAVLNRIAPGVVVDLCSDKPKVLTVMLAGMQNVRADVKGHEPSIDEVMEIQENFIPSKPSSFRKKKYSKMKDGNDEKFDPSLVYTFEAYDDMVDYTTYSMDFKGHFSIDMTTLLNRQPFQIMSKSTSRNEYLWQFNIFNERLLNGECSHDDC